MQTDTQRLYQRTLGELVAFRLRPRSARGPPRAPASTTPRACPLLPPTCT